MPQIFQVLRCYKCLVFQVHQAKKSNKFACKMCGEKQSIKRHYGVGNGQECRGHVQKLNGIRGQLDESKSIGDSLSSDEDDYVPSPLPVKPMQTNKSKWSDFVDTEEVVETTNENSEEKMFLENTEVVLDIPKKKRRKRFNTAQRYKKQSEPVLNFVEESDFDAHKISSTKCDVIDKYHSKQVSLNNEKHEFYKVDNKNISRNEKQLEVQHEYNNIENIDGNLTSHNISKSSPIKRKNIKFIPPAINPKSKWAQFTNDESVDASLTSNIIETQCYDELEKEDLKEDDPINSQNDTLNYDIPNNIKLNSESNSHNQSNWDIFTTDLDEIEECDLENEDNINENYVNLINVEENNCESSLPSQPTHVQSNKNEPKDLFSLCDDSEIDNFLDI